jgi:hypothetical protein
VTQWVFTDYNGGHGNALLWRAFDAAHNPLPGTMEIFIQNPDGSISLDGYVNPDGTFLAVREDDGSVEEYAPPHIDEHVHLTVGEGMVGGVWRWQHAQAYYPPSPVTDNPFQPPAWCVRMDDMYGDNMESDLHRANYLRDVWYARDIGPYKIVDRLTGGVYYLLHFGEW